MATIESGARFGIPMVFLVSGGFIATCVIVIFVRRWTAAKQSGGPFTAPFHIAKGMFYIHVAFCFKKRLQNNPFRLELLRVSSLF